MSRLWIYLQSDQYENPVTYLEPDPERAADYVEYVPATEAEDLRAKLAKATEALKWISENPMAHQQNAVYVARTALQEIE